jgi:hypothetical protein
MDNSQTNNFEIKKNIIVKNLVKKDVSVNISNKKVVYLHCSSRLG